MRAGAAAGGGGTPGVKLGLAENSVRDAEQFCELSNALYARPVDAAYYAWQFFAPPFPAFLAAAKTAEDELAGCYGMHVKPTVAGPSIGWAIDIMVAPRFQRRGLFRRLAAEAEQRAQPSRPVALCVMANEKAEAAHAALGWSRVNAFVDHVRETAPGGEPGTLEWRPLQSLAECGDLLEAAEGRIRASGLTATLRSADALEWRFFRNPRYKYSVFLARRQATPRLLLVLKVFGDPVSGERFGDVVDVIWADDDPALLAEALRFAVVQFHDRGVPRATVWLQTNTRLDEVGREAGFRPTPRRRFFCCKVLDPAHGKLTDPRRWFLTMADSEVY